MAIAVVALIATSVQAADPYIKKDSGWPTVYVALPICDIPVIMDVGMYVQLKECNKREIKLTQVDCPEGRKFPCYTGCDTEVQIRANFLAEVSLKFNEDSSVAGKIKKSLPYFNNDVTQLTESIPADGVYKKITVCLDAWETVIWEIGPGDKVKVGTVSVLVRPQ